jgi:O-antigen ligase
MPGIILMFFFRNIVECFFSLFFLKVEIRKTFFTIFEIIIFNITIYYLIDYNHKILNKELMNIYIISFLFWAITISYISVESNFLYHNDNVKNERELRIIEGIATKSDKMILFFQNFIFSPVNRQQKVD